MICDNCISDDFAVVKVYRNRRMKEGRWVANDNVDTRLVLCNKCGTRYLTETVITHKITYKMYKTFVEGLKDNSQSEINFDNNIL